MTEQKQGSISLGSEYDVHLDLGKRIPISEEPLFDYTKFKLPGILKLAEKTRAERAQEPPERSNDEWRKIGAEWGSPGDILVNFIVKQHSGNIEFTPGHPKGDALKAIREKMNNRYDFIMLPSTQSPTQEQKGDGGIDTSISGLENIFKYKSQVINPSHKIMKTGGPTDFFRFLFDFVVPPSGKLKGICKKDSIRAIIERTPAASRGGQCWKSYGDNVDSKSDEAYDGRLWSSPPPEDRRMHCYICEVKLKSKHKSYIDSFVPLRSKDRDFQCEHLFPFTEGMLFWLLYQDYLNANPSDATAAEYVSNLVRRQKREYAPVCRHCNVVLKSSLGILQINPDWPNASDANADIVLLNIDSLNKISGQYDKLPEHAKKYPNFGPKKQGFSIEQAQQAGRVARLQRLKDVFTPMVAAINQSLTVRGITSPQDLSKFLIYKYLFYFQNDVMDDIEKMLIGGGGSKKILKEKKARNNILADMLGTIMNQFKKYKKQIKEGIKIKKKVNEAFQKAKKLYDQAKRQKEKKEEKFKQAKARLIKVSTRLRQVEEQEEIYSKQFLNMFQDKFFPRS